jgi:hypothetical protein
MLEEKYENYFNRRDVFNIFYCAPGATAWTQAWVSSSQS